MLEEGQVKCSADGVVLVLREYNMTTVVAGLDGTQDVLRIVCAVAVGFDGTSLCARRRRWEWFAGVVRRNWVVWPLGWRNFCAPLFNR